MTRNTGNTIGWIVVSLLSFMIGWYPITYFLVDRNFGLLSSKSDELLDSMPWNIGFYCHIIFGGIALLTGWIQFSKKIRTNRIHLHRIFGKIYVFSVFISSLAGIYIAIFATGGMIASAGFIGLGLTWFFTTYFAFNHIRHRRILEHQQLMIYSFAACFAAVTLRIWLPVLTSLFHDFTIAYRIVAWLCWIPNILVAFFINKKYTRFGFTQSLN